MVASIRETLEIREKIHNLNLDIKEHQEYYDVMVERFIWQNEGYWNDRTNTGSFKNAMKDDIRIAKRDTEGNLTVGLGFNMDRKEAREEWEQCFGEANSFDEVFLSKKVMTSEEAVHLFRHGIAIRRKELKSFFQKD